MKQAISEQSQTHQNQFLKIGQNISSNLRNITSLNIAQKQNTSFNENLMATLKQFNKLKTSSNPNSGSSLQSQLSQLSKAYNTVQTKLLQTQKLLYMETILSQKQRSIIQLLKYVLSTNNQHNYQQDYESIVVFISKMQAQNNYSKQGKNIVKIELDDIKRIIQQNKIKRMRQGKQTDQIRQLKLELNKMMQHSLTLQQTFCQVNDDNYELKQSIKQKENEIVNLREHIKKLQENQYNLKEQIQNQVNKEQEQNVKIKNDLKNQNLKIKFYQSAFLKVTQMINHFIPKQSQKQKQKQNKNDNKQSINNSNNNKQQDQQSSDKSYLEYSFDDNKQFQASKIIENLRKILNKSLSNKQELKTYKNKLKNHQFLQNQIKLLKGFISEQGLSIFRQYELTQGKQKCLEEEIKNYSKIQRQRMQQLEQCQLEMWRIRNKMLKQQNCQKTIFSAINSCQQSPYLEKLFNQNLQNTRFKSNISTQFKEPIQIKDFKQSQESETI